MKILVIMKRFGANKDIVEENFRRQIRLFENLAKKHSIDFLCPDYVKKESKTITRNGIRYIVRPVSLISVFSLYSSLKKLIRKEKYGIIFASTDSLIGIVGYRLSKKFSIPLIYDLQDNFESYDTYKIPFVKYFDRKVLKKADAVITVSDSLKRYISKIRGNPIYTIQNGIDLKLFKITDKATARKKLKLPLKYKIIVFIGHIEKLKGGQILIDAFNIIRDGYPDTYLLLSGRIGNDVDINKKNVIYRKFPEREEVMLGINAADVAVLPNPVNSFTKYCFPYKLLEYMACNVPIVATDVGDVSKLLKKYEGSLCKPDDAFDLAKKIMAKVQLDGRVNYRKDLREFDWRILSMKMEKIINNIRR